MKIIVKFIINVGYGIMGILASYVLLIPLFLEMIIESTLYFLFAIFKSKKINKVLRNRMRGNANALYCLTLDLQVGDKNGKKKA